MLSRCDKTVRVEWGVGTCIDRGRRIRNLRSSTSFSEFEASLGPETLPEGGRDGECKVEDEQIMVA